jgi:hypothetical protein
MSETDVIGVGEPLPLIESVTAQHNWMVTVIWAGGRRQLVDLAPAIFTHKFYRPLRDDQALFRTVHILDEGFAIAWGRGDEIDMDASTIARLAEEAMQPADFAAFLKRHKLTYEAAAAQLGISRRLVAYYASERQVPRYIALACAYLEERLGSSPGPSEQAEPAAEEGGIGHAVL